MSAGKSENMSDIASKLLSAKDKQEIKTKLRQAIVEATQTLKSITDDKQPAPVGKTHLLVAQKSAKIKEFSNLAKSLFGDKADITFNQNDVMLQLNEPQKIRKHLPTELQDLIPKEKNPENAPIKLGRLDKNPEELADAILALHQANELVSKRSQLGFGAKLLDATGLKKADLSKLESAAARERKKALIQKEQERSKQEEQARADLASAAKGALPPAPPSPITQQGATKPLAQGTTPAPTQADIVAQAQKNCNSGKRSTTYSSRSSGISRRTAYY